MTRYLHAYYDPGLEVALPLVPQEVAQAECDRLTALLTLAQLAGDIPRRLGGDALGSELALDKKRCRRVQHVAEQLIKAWGCKPAAPGDLKREAAVVDWAAWFADHGAYLEGRMRYIATACLKYEADELECKRMLVRYQNELRWLSYALRD